VTVTQNATVEGLEITRGLGRKGRHPVLALWHSEAHLRLRTVVGRIERRPMGEALDEQQLGDLDPR